jgi:acyl carrier protein
MSNQHTLQSQVAKLLTDELHLEVPSPDCDLVEEGILDSLAFVDLIMTLEKQFHISISFDRIEVDNFRSVAKIADFVCEHRW